jgi:[NiFe] hydrogenase diaphorase moiety large subunit
VLLTECPELVFEGMAVAGYAVGADKGLIYLRAEYIYLKPYLEGVLANLRKNNILGANAGGKSGFNFDIAIQMGAGAYVCGEESALIDSAEGKRGEPRNRPPFPVQRGFMGLPTSVNNVETFASAARIMTKGAAWFKGMGTEQSAGTKVLSVSGDCKKPGIYEVPFGTTIDQLLEMVDGKDAKAVLVGGPSGTFIGKKDYGRKICFSDLGTGGSMMIFGPDRDLLDIVKNFMEFFVEESCGWCVPCRAGNVILLNKLETIIEGHGTESDIKDLESWCQIVKTMSRCGLGQTSPNPIQSTIKNFREIYDAKVKKDSPFLPSFSLEEAVQASCKYAGRTPKFEEHH